MGLGGVGCSVQVSSLVRVEIHISPEVMCSDVVPVSSRTSFTCGSAYPPIAPRRATSSRGSSRGQLVVQQADGIGGTESRTASPTG
jgi:hypothetical protein